MTRPQDMGPADLAPNTVPPETITTEQTRVVERNAFYNSLPPEAKERFLESLSAAAERGLSEEAAWIEAVEAAEMTYEPDLGMSEPAGPDLEPQDPAPEA